MEATPSRRSLDAAPRGSGPVVARPSVSSTSRGRRSFSRSRSRFSTSAPLSSPAPARPRPRLLPPVGTRPAEGRALLPPPPPAPHPPPPPPPPRRRGRAPAGRQPREPGGRQLHAGGRRQEHLRLLAPEGDKSHLVASLVGVGEQREDGALHGGHPPPGGHRPARVHDEEDEIALASLAHVLPQVRATQDEPLPRPAPGSLVRG